MIIEKCVFRVQFKCNNCGLIWYEDFSAGACVFEDRGEVAISRRVQVSKRIRCPNCELLRVEVMSRHPID